MNRRTRPRAKILTSVLVCCLAATAAVAQGTAMLDKGHVTKIEIAVWDPVTHGELVQLQLGETLELPAGQSVLVRLYAPRGHGPGEERNYLPARFHLAKGGGVEVSAEDAAKGSYRLTASSGPSVAEVRYELGKSITVDRPFMRDHFFKVEVTPAAIAPPVPSPDPAWAKAHAMIERLYRGILMRDLRNPEGSREWVERVYRGGYPALVDVAFEIARSDESTIQIPRRGTTSEERLLAIYQHLLDLERDEIDRYQWQDHLEMVDDHRDVTDVVMDIVRSPEFRRVHGYN